MVRPRQARRLPTGHRICRAEGPLLVVSRGIEASTSQPMNAKLNRIVAMLARRSLRAESVSGRANA